MLLWVTVTSSAVFVLMMTSITNILKVSADVNLLARFKANGFYESIHQVDDVTCASSLTSCPFIWNDTIMIVNMELDTPSRRFQGLVITCYGCQGPLVVSVDIDNTGDQTTTLWPILDWDLFSNTSGARNCNPTSCQATNSSTMTSQMSDNAMSFYEFHSSLLGQNVTNIRVTFHNKTVPRVADKAPCCPDVPCEYHALLNGIIRHVDVIAITENVTKTTSNLTNKSHGVICSSCSPASYPVNMTVTTNTILRILIDLHGHGLTSVYNESICPPTVNIQINISNTVLTYSTVQQQCIRVTQYSHQCRQYVFVVALNNTTASPTECQVQRPSTGPSSMKSSGEPSTGPSGPPGPSTSRQEIHITSMNVTFPSCIATNYSIHLQSYDFCGNRNAQNQSTSEEHRICNHDNTTKTIATPYSSTVASNLPSSTFSTSGMPEKTTITTPATTLQPPMTTTPAKTVIETTATVISSSSPFTTSSSTTTTTTATTKTVATSASHLSTTHTTTTSPTKTTAALTSSALTSLLTSRSCHYDDITTRSMTSTLTSGSSLLPVTAAQTNYTIRFKIINEEYQPELDVTSSPLYRNYSSFIGGKIDDVLIGMCLGPPVWNKAMVFTKGSVITHCWLTLSATQLLNNSTQFADSVILALSPRFTVDNSSFSVLQENNSNATIPATSSGNQLGTTSGEQLIYVGIGVGCGAALIIIIFLIVLLAIVARRHNRKRSATGNNPDAIIDSWSIPRPQPLVWQSNSTMTASMMRHVRHHGNGQVHKETSPAVEMQPRVAPRPDDVTGIGGQASPLDDVTAELDRVIAEHETASDLSSPDQWTSGRHSGSTLPVPRLLRVDTNMLQFAGDKHGGNIDINRPSRVPADNMSRVIPPKINEFAVRRHLPDVMAQNIDNDVRRGPEALHHVTSVTDHRQFDEESFSDVLTYYGSTGNLQRGGVLTRLQQTLSKATDYLKPPKVDNIHRTLPGYMKTSSPRHKPPSQADMDMDIDIDIDIDSDMDMDMDIDIDIDSDMDMAERAEELVL